MDEPVSVLYDIVATGHCLVRCTMKQTNRKSHLWHFKSRCHLTATLVAQNDETRGLGEFFLWLDGKKWAWWSHVVGRARETAGVISDLTRGRERQEVTIIFWYHTSVPRNLIYSVCSCTVLREVLIKGRKNFDTCEAEINI